MKKSFIRATMGKCDNICNNKIHKKKNTSSLIENESSFYTIGLMHNIKNQYCSVAANVMHFKTSIERNGWVWLYFSTEDDNIFNFFFFFYCTEKNEHNLCVFSPPSAVTPAGFIYNQPRRFQWHAETRRQVHISSSLRRLFFFF